jgi:hypothetical protein
MYMQCQHCPRKQHARGLCRVCYDKWLKEKNPGYAQRQRDNRKAWAKRNGKYLNSYQTERERNLAAKRYGISRAEIDGILDRGCEVCGGSERLCIDHDHATGAVRGCLCITCNVGVGWVEKPGWLDRALRYLRRASGSADGRESVA